MISINFIAVLVVLVKSNQRDSRGRRPSSPVLLLVSNFSHNPGNNVVL